MLFDDGCPVILELLVCGTGGGFVLPFRDIGCKGRMGFNNAYGEEHGGSIGDGFVVLVGKVLGIFDARPEFFDGVGVWVPRCRQRVPVGFHVGVGDAVIVGDQMLDDV